MSACPYERFAENTATHAIEIVVDNGVYRHIKCRRPGTYCYGFDIVTYPGHLVMSGDMGAWVFTRMHDMFEFFRAGVSDREAAAPALYINRSYWAEKVVASDRGGIREYSSDKFEARVREELADWLAEQEGELIAEETDDAPEQRSAAVVPEDLAGLIEELIEAGSGDEESARAGLDDFRDPEGRIEFHDTWEWNVEDYTHGFVWACYAIAWTLLRYDEAKAAKAEAVTP